MTDTDGLLDYEAARETYSIVLNRRVRDRATTGKGPLESACDVAAKPLLAKLAELQEQNARGVRCCGGCPDCVGIGVREQILGLIAERDQAVARCAELEQRLNTTTVLLEQSERDLDRPCPYVRTSDEGTSFCTLAERGVL